MRHNATFQGEGFKEATLNGNQEKGSQEGKESRQEETLNDPGGAWASLILCRKYWPPRLRSRRSFRCAQHTSDDMPVVSRVGSC